jgi:hypothetical protein
MAKNILKHGTAIRIGTLSVAPNPATNGTMYYNTSDNYFKIYENNQWQNIASRSYVDSVAAGFDPKESVEAATTGNISLASAPASVDGVTLAENDRVLVRAQTNKTQNGIYKVVAGSLVRTADFDDGIEVNGGEYVFVKGGDVYAGTAWVVTAPDSAATMGVSEIEWTQVSGAGKSLQNAYMFGATITTTSAKGPVIIEGSESLSITATGGLSVTTSASVSQGLNVGGNASIGTNLYVGTTASVASGLAVGSSGAFRVSLSGDLTKINNVSYSFPTTQASGSGYLLLNDGSGNLSWKNFSSDVLNDFMLTNLQDGQLIRYDSAIGKWVNEAPVSTSGSAYSVVTTNGAGYLDSSFLQYNVNLGGNVLSGVATPVASTDAANKAYVDRLTLQIIYDQDANGSDATITTNSVDGAVVIAGSEKLSVTAASGAEVLSMFSAGSGKFSVSASGNVTKINNVSYSFPAAQATVSNYALVNDGSGNLTWGALAVSELSDLSLTSLSDNQLLRYNSTSGKWENESAISATAGTADAGKILMSDASGRLDTSFLQYNVNLGGNVLSGVAAPVASTDAANKGYVDAKTLQDMYSQDVNGGDAIITTNSVDGAVVIAGSEKLSVTANKGAEVVSMFTAGSGKFSVSASGDLTKINNVSYSFPAAQAASANHALVNDGSGNLSWNTLALSGLSDVGLSSLADNQLLRYNSTSGKWENESAISATSGATDAGKILMTDASGLLATSFLQYNINMGGYPISNVGAPVASSDVATKSYVDSAAFGLTLQKAYEQDGDGSDALITTTSVDGAVVIAGSEKLKVSATGGLLVSGASGIKLADPANEARYVDYRYKDAMALAGGSSNTVLAALSYPVATYSGCVVSYHLKDDSSGKIRVGTMLVSNSAGVVSFTDTFSETDDLGVTWAASVSGGNVEFLYTAGAGNKSLSAEIKRFLA